MKFTKEFFESDAFIGNLEKCLKKFLESDYNKDKVSIIMSSKHEIFSNNRIIQHFALTGKNLVFSCQFSIIEDFPDYDLEEVVFDYENSRVAKIVSNTLPQLNIEGACTLFIDKEIFNIEEQAIFIPIKWPTEVYHITEHFDQFCISCLHPVYKDLDFEFLAIPYTYKKKRRPYKQ